MRTAAPPAPPAPEPTAASPESCCVETAVQASETPGQLRREALFVAVAFTGLVAGLVGEWTGGPGLVWLGYGAAYGFGGWFGVRAGLDAIRRFRVDIDLLMVLAALGALAIGAPFEGAMLLFLFSLSNVLQHYAVGRSRKAIRALMELRPETAHVRRGDAIHPMPVEEVAPGAVYVLKPGDRLPLDGVVVEGTGEVDQASLTGESVPVLKRPGDAVFGGTINGGGALEVRVTKRAGESAIARLIRLVEEAQSEKAETQRVLDRFEQPYALGVIGLTAVAVALPVGVLGEAFEPAFYRAMTLMVAASPCALIISTPAAVLSAIAAGARSGVLFKGGVYVEQAATVRAVAFDKTGTLTEGATHLTDVVPLGGADEGDVLALAAAVQASSEHHLAAATLAAATAQGLPVAAAEAFQATVGQGVAARVDGRTVRIGNLSFFDGPRGDGWDAAESVVARLEGEAKTAVVVAEEQDGAVRALGVTAFADRLRPVAPEVIRRLKALGIEHVAMITGDNEAVAERVGEAAGVDAVWAAVMPEQKVELVKGLRDRYGSVAYVGDGVNDGPALAAATVGVAMGGAGTDVALETADLVLMGDDLTKLPYALRLSRKTRRTLVANLVFALAMIVVMVTSILSVGLPLPLAVVGHEGSTVVVSLNGLRLLTFRDRGA
ncbi:MAG: heavy metal translocating P-type ATPase [Rubricoccaceae bacterium]|nr:heavy metal translocating P-type ATPase [Rubricoccaceae bacterium]